MEFFSFHLFWKETRDIIFHPIKHFSTMLKDNSYPYAIIKACLYMFPSWIFEIILFLHAKAGTPLMRGAGAGIFEVLIFQIVTFTTGIFVIAILFYLVGLIFGRRESFRAAVNVTSSLMLIYGFIIFVFCIFYSLGLDSTQNYQVKWIFSLAASLYGSWILYIAIEKTLGVRLIWAKSFFVLMILANSFLFINYKFKFLAAVSGVLPGFLARPFH